MRSDRNPSVVVQRPRNERSTAVNVALANGFKETQMEERRTCRMIFTHKHTVQGDTKKAQLFAIGKESIK